MKNLKQYPAMLQKGFTLIEITVVLVIVGLLIGGILAGEELVVQARINSQISQLKEYEQGMVSFNTKYGCIPGDCLRAATYFPGMTNGNGNDQIETNNGSSFDNALWVWSTHPELKSVFAELSLAQLVKGKFDTSDVIGKGMPKMKINPKTTFFVGNRANLITTPGSRTPDIAPYAKGTNFFLMLACNITPGSDMPLWDDGCGIFTPEELLTLDTKMDDGQPISGLVLAFNGFGLSDCLLNNSGVYTYNTDITSSHCQASYAYIGNRMKVMD